MARMQSTFPQAPAAGWHEYIASVTTRRGAHETVTVHASSPQDAHARLTRMGYARIGNITRN